MLVNNAGAMTKSAFIDMPFTQSRQNFANECRWRVSLRADRRRHMIKQGEGGRIINITLRP
ncbi:hypothetical protein KCP71_15850 [Salmonella enterica subsp. enterica]|nr:hypothetical protein KCP71_15850 [Salmonella enterica subsp. enterica]